METSVRHARLAHPARSPVKSLHARFAWKEKNKSRFLIIFFLFICSRYLWVTACNRHGGAAEIRKLEAKVTIQSLNLENWNLHKIITWPLNKLPPKIHLLMRYGVFIYDSVIIHFSNSQANVELITMPGCRKLLVFFGFLRTILWDLLEAGPSENQARPWYPEKISTHRLTHLCFITYRPMHEVH